MEATNNNAAESGPLSSILKTAGAALLLLLVLGIGISLWWDHQPDPAGDQPIELPPAPSVDPSAIITLIPPDSIRAIDDPQHETADQAIAHLDPNERIIGLIINGEARAYPIPILSTHEIVNDVVGGEPVAITWCPLCYTAIVFSRRVAGQETPVTLAVSGKLLYNTLVMFDRQTNTLWSQLYGTAVDGPLNGKSLAIFPSLHTEWAAWQAQYPDTLVLSKQLTCAQFNCGDYSTNPRGSYAVDAYASYYNTPAEGVIDHQIPRDLDESGPKQRVLGVRLGDVSRAYPYETLRERPLINDNINGVPVLIWFDPATQTGTAFIRRVEEQALTFRADPDTPGVLFDLEIGSRWQATNGMAVDGRLRNAQLPALVATSAFAFSWYDYFPDSDTYVPDK